MKIKDRVLIAILSVWSFIHTYFIIINFDNIKDVV